MRFVTFETNDQKQHWGIHERDLIWSLSEEEGDLLSFIEAGEEGLQLFHQRYSEGTLTKFHAEDVQLKAPYIPRKNIVCVGKNYAEHALEMSGQNRQSIPQHPVFFTKPPSAVIGPGEAIQAHEGVTEALDYEGELVVIIGKKGKNIARKEAYRYVFGYSIMNDVTARNLQKQHQQFFKGKSLDTFAPWGPAIIHHTEINDPASLRIETYVNDDKRQDGSTRDMIFSIPELIETLSQGMTLEPGDMIATGTPSGVGKGFQPPRYLHKEDVVTIEIEGIGKLQNQVQ